MGMAAKKERGRFSLRFNIGDPVQRAAVELLELQPPHRTNRKACSCLGHLPNGRRESGFDIQCTGAEARVYTGSGRSAGD